MFHTLFVGIYFYFKNPFYRLAGGCRRRRTNFAYNRKLIQDLEWDVARQTDTWNKYRIHIWRAERRENIFNSAKMKGKTQQHHCFLPALFDCHYTSSRFKSCFSCFKKIYAEKLKENTGLLQTAIVLMGWFALGNFRFNILSRIQIFVRLAMSFLLLKYFLLLFYITDCFPIWNIKWYIVAKYWICFL